MSRKLKPSWSVMSARVYQAVLVRAVRNYRRAAAIAAVFLVLCLSLGLRLGTEFLPKLEEGNMWIRAVMPPTITLEAGMDTVARIRAIISSYPPVQTVFSEQGRGDEGTDPDGSFLAEFFVPLKPAEQVAAGTDQGADGQADERAAQPRIRRHRLQFLAVHPGQYRGSRLRRERRELDQDLRQGPQRTGAAVQVGENRTRRASAASPTPPASICSASPI